MKDYAVLTNDGKYTIFEFNNQRVRFVTSDKLERYMTLMVMVLMKLSRQEFEVLILDGRTGEVKKRAKTPFYYI